MNIHPLVSIFACGSIDRGDDGVGAMAVGALIAKLDRTQSRRIAIVRCAQLDVQHLLDVPVGVPLIIVDAAIGVRAGAVVKLPLDELITRRGGPRPNSSHALPIHQALGIANVLAAEPLKGYFVGVGGADFTPGRHLSTAVTNALPALIATVEQALIEFMPQAVTVAGD